MKQITFILAAFALTTLAYIPRVSADELTAEQLTFFETKIRPVMIRECYGCHSNKSGNARGGLRLDTKELMAIGGSTGPAIVPGDLEESLLLTSMKHESFEMPPKRKLSSKIIKDFETWIKMGAPDPRINKITQVNSKITPKEIELAKKSFWAYQKPVKHSPPVVENSKWPRTEIDNFVLAKLEQADLEPADDAEPNKILRRLTFDLIGLPPMPEHIKAFNDAWKEDPDEAVEWMVDQLLKSDRFGERWGRHWMDVARYAESTGRGINMTYPQAWRYRDYIIKSFNDDKPYNRFVQEQLAGDLLPAKTDEQWAENLIATTFLAIGSKNVNEDNRVQFAADIVDEQIDATTRVFLGMSVACARCHDHKFDAIPQTDYYAMAGIFQSMKTYFGNPQSKYGSYSDAPERQSSTLMILPIDDPGPFAVSYTSRELDEFKSQMDSKRQEIMESRRSGGEARLNQRVRGRFNKSMTRLSGILASVDDNGKPLSFCMGVQEESTPKDAKVLVRGEIGLPAQSVPRGFPQVMTEKQQKLKGKSSGRLELARWIGSDQNTLTARVMVNRIWLHMIGQGIVTSTENFGTTGQLPSHPELLDYLAVRFVESGWSVKTIIREISTSRVYRIASTFNQEFHEYDPENTLVWRANPKRLDAEALRDAMLIISGELDRKQPQASVVAKAGFMRVSNRDLAPPGRSRSGGGNNSQKSKLLDMETAKFRSVYLPMIRDEEPRSMSVFNFVDSSAITGQREQSNTANQSLYMMNNPFVVQQSQAFAKRLHNSGKQLKQQIDYAVLLAYGRKATSSERNAILEFARNYSKSINDRGSMSKTISAVCQSLFASSEFRYID